MPSRASDSEITAAVIPDPHEVTIGLCKSTLPAAKIARNSLGDFMTAVAGSNKSVNGTLRLFGM